MIVARITGGVGNQLFQYAFAMYLARKHNTKLKLDITEYKFWKLRKFELDKFKINADLATEREIKLFLKYSYYIPKAFQSVFHNIFKFLFPEIIYEEHFHFDRINLNLPDNIYLIGFWQSEKYFSDIEDILRKELILKESLSEKSKKLLNIIYSTDSVSINFRRGEFVTNPDINRRHGVLDLSYYKKAVQLIKQRIKRAHFFIFSDDIEWVLSNYKLDDDVTFVDINYPDRVYEDLILGSKCKHNIIANSTFSWWTAWLNKNKNKIVIAPKNWFNRIESNTKDLIPEGWLKI